LEWPEAFCSLTQTLSLTGSAWLYSCKQPWLAAWQPGLSTLISSCVCSGWVPASPSPSENKKTCFASGRVEWGLLSGSRTAPQRGHQWAGSLLLLECRAGSLAVCFLQLSKHCRLGRKPLSVPRPLQNPLSQQGNNGLDGLVGGWRGSPSVPVSTIDRQVAGGGSALFSPHLPQPLSCFPPC
jgi:hypothetical protein